MPYIGFSPGMGTRDRFIYTATASQTTFSGADDNGKTLRYDSGDFVDVYLNGILLVPVTDYTATSLTSIVLTQAASADDTLEVLSLQAVTVADTVSKSQGGDFEAGINVDGKLGIGTTSPNSTLHLEGAAPTFELRDTDLTGQRTLIQGNTTDGGLQLDIDRDDQVANTTFKIRVDSTERMRIDSDGNVGFSVSSPASIVGGTDTNPVVSIGGYDTVLTTGDKAGSISFTTVDSSYLATYSDGVTSEIASVAQSGTGAAYAIAFYTGTITSSNRGERMRIDPSGNLVIGKTSANNTAEGTTLYNTDGFSSVRSGGVVGIINRTTSAGEALSIRYNGASAGGLGVTGSHMSVFGNTGYVGIGGTDATSPHYWAYNLALYPSQDNTRDLGTSGNRYDDVRATNGTIQTSDEREKQQIASLTDAEITAAKAISKLFKTFKWNSAVTEKGDAARTHTGVIAQQVETAMTDAGLNAGDYAFFIDDTWWEVQTDVPAVEAVDEVLDEDGSVITEAVEAKEAYTRTDNYYTVDEAPEGATERNRKGIRYPELLSFIGAATEQRLASIESRLDALEAN